jgi:hypothetical protein
LSEAWWVLGYWVALLDALVLTEVGLSEKPNVKPVTMTVHGVGLQKSLLGLERRRVTSRQV